MTEKFLPLGINISQTCPSHKLPYQTYCKDHETSCCRKCVLENHKKCREVVAISNMVRNVKDSTYMSDLQTQLEDLVRDIKMIKDDRKINARRIEEERQNIEKEISLLRQKTYDSPDEVQTGIIKDLYDKAVELDKTTNELLKNLTKRESEVIEMQCIIIDMRKNATNMEIFLAMKQIETVKTETEGYLQKLKEQGCLDHASLTFYVHKTIPNVWEKEKSFGEISVKTTKSNITLEERKTKQAQTALTMPSKSIYFISLTLNQKLKLDYKKINGCHILPNNTVLLVSSTNGRLVALNKNRRKIFDLDLPCPHSLSGIDSNMVAVATDKYISVVDIKKRSVKRKIDVEHRIHGLTYKNGKLICASTTGIISVKLDDESVTLIVDCNLQSTSDVTGYGDNIYYTVGLGFNTVTCCDKDGNMIWRFEDESVLRDVRGITVDGEGNLYVTGYDTDNVVVISSNGMQYKEVLSDKDGLLGPTTIHCDTASKQLIVTDFNDRIFFCNINPILIY